MLSVIMLSVIMLSVIMPHDIMPIVVLWNVIELTSWHPHHSHIFIVSVDALA
jgi:hypothetical protein